MPQNATRKRWVEIGACRDCGWLPGEGESLARKKRRNGADAGIGQRCVDCAEKVRVYSTWHNHTPQKKQAIDKYCKSDKGKANRAANSKIQNAKPARKEVLRRRNKVDQAIVMKHPVRKLAKTIRVGLCRMLQLGYRCTAVQKHVGFANATELKNHLHPMLADGMTLSTYGYGAGKWNIGHRIAESQYSASMEDLERCFSKNNLFPQWHTENAALSKRLPCNSELLNLKSSWPIAWNDLLPDEKARAEFERPGVWAVR